MAVTLQLKRAFGGKFVVMSDGDEQVFGPASMADCQAWVAEREGSPQPAAASAPNDEAEARRREREWAKIVDRTLRQPLDEEEAELRALLSKRRNEDEVDYLMRTMRPHLQSGLDGARRERGKHIRMMRQQSQG
jgi:hypothetical protein